MIKESREKGHFTQVMFSPRPYVDAICNCGQWCGRWKVPELEWANTSSFMMSKPYRADRCDDCGICLKDVMHTQFQYTRMHRVWTPH